MQRFRVDKVLWAWVAAGALLYGIVAPFAMQGLRADPASRWAEICTALGSKWVKLAGGASDAPRLPALAHLDGHCPLCSTQGAEPGVPSRHAPMALPSTLFDVPSHAPAATVPAAAWRIAQPRGPPRMA